MLRPGYGGDDPHVSETHVSSLSVDLEITATSLAELRERVKEAWMGCKARGPARRQRRFKERHGPEELSRRQRAARLTCEYGVTSEDYARMYAEQNGCCATCSRFKAVLCVDHDHRTEQVRGLLCQVCNSAIDVIDPELAAAYQRLHGITREEITCA